MAFFAYYLNFIMFFIYFNSFIFWIAEYYILLKCSSIFAIISFFTFDILPFSFYLNCYTEDSASTFIISFLRIACTSCLSSNCKIRNFWVDLLDNHECFLSEGLSACLCARLHEFWCKKGIEGEGNPLNCRSLWGNYLCGRHILVWGLMGLKSQGGLANLTAFNI